MLFVFAIILIGVAVICFFLARSERTKARAVQQTDTYQVQLLQQLHQRVRDTLGAEALAEQCEVAGVIESAAPLTAPLSRTPCVAYRYVVTREYEEEVSHTDSEGKTTTEMRRAAETVSSEERHTEFWVRDPTGRVLVDPERAEIDYASSGERYDQAHDRGRRTRTLGHRHREESLAVGAQVFVHGCAIDRGGALVIAGNPRDDDQRFFISRSSEQELLRSAESSARLLVWVAAGSGALGLFLLVLGLIG